LTPYEPDSTGSIPTPPPLLRRQRAARSIVRAILLLGVGYGVWFFYRKHEEAKEGRRQLYADVAALLTPPCSAGSAHACGDLGVLYAEGFGVSKDLERAVALLQKACDGDYLKGCEALGFEYENGTGVSRDPARAAALFQKACTEDSTAGCYNLAFNYENGEGVAQDKSKAEKLYQMGCANDFTHHCGKLSGAKPASDPIFDPPYAEGLNRSGFYEQNHKQFQDAVLSLGESCAMGSGRACIALGTMYGGSDNEFGIAQDDAKATELFSKGHRLLQEACSKHDQDACDEIKNPHPLYYPGAG
jgi:TPR repeat protein